MCPSHLKDPKFCTPIIDKAAVEAKKKKEMEEELARVKKEYEEKQKRKKEKEKESEKEGDEKKEGDKKKDEKTDDTKSDSKVCCDCRMKIVTFDQPHLTWRLDGRGKLEPRRPPPKRSLEYSPFTSMLL